MEHNRLTKVTLVSFPQKPSFKAIVQFRPKAAEILHLMSQAIMFHDSLSKNYEYILNNLNATEA